MDAAGFALDAGHTVHLTVLQCYVRRADLEAALVAALAPYAGASGPRETLHR